MASGWGATGCACARGRDAHAGVLERENRIRSAARCQRDARSRRSRPSSRRLRGVRESAVPKPKPRATRCSSASSGAHREYSEARGAARGHARPQPAGRAAAGTHRPRGRRCAARTRAHAAGAGARARRRWTQATAQLEAARSPPQRPGRRARRAARGQPHGAREPAHAARAQARELLIQLEGRRSTESSLAATLQRHAGTARPARTAPAAARGRTGRRR